MARMPSVHWFYSTYEMDMDTESCIWPGCQASTGFTRPMKRKMINKKDIDEKSGSDKVIIGKCHVFQMEILINCKGLSTYDFKEIYSKEGIRQRDYKMRYILNQRGNKRGRL